MLFPKLHFLTILLTTLCFFSPSFAVKKSYIVYLGAHEHSRYGRQVSAAHQDKATNFHYEFLGSFLGSTDKAKEAIIYSYNKHINGFSARLEEKEAAQIAKHPDVVSVFPSQLRKLHTTRSWQFMLQEKNNGVTYPRSLMSKARYGEDVIIANLDSGVWPESKSFCDDGYGPIPSRWYGGCQNNTKAGVPCNKKLIGAKFYPRGYEAATGHPIPSEMRSPRDFNGHGTHTLSTAGGNFVPGVNIMGLGNGTAKGGSPKARVAAYKVCWLPNDCYDDDILQGLEDAIYDGVDIISVSLGGIPGDYFNNGIAIGAFHAVKNGVVVVASAGNSGPELKTVDNGAPWIITVGASTEDRDFVSVAQLGNGKRLKGVSVTDKRIDNKKLYPLITGLQAKAANASALDALLCLPGTLDHEKVRGKITVCLRGQSARVLKGYVSAEAGAVGMILCNDETSGNEIIADAHFLPATHVSYEDGEVIFAYVNNTKNPAGFVYPPETKYNDTNAPFMAAFSSRGPSHITPDILKPDVTAPGVAILAAYSEAASVTGIDEDNRVVAYNVDSGTSMSCPHVSGVVGLLKTLHPDWSPSAIRSAIMTSARVIDNRGRPMLDGANFQEATPFARGSGHIRPNRAMDPGLVYDMGIDDYVHFLCAIGYDNNKLQPFSEGPRPYKCSGSESLLDFNYPSFTVTELSGKVIMSRRVTNVGKPGTYVAKIVEPHGFSVKVEPSSLTFERIGEELSFKLTLEPKCNSLPIQYKFGELQWTDGCHHVSSPIVVKGITRKN
ncbi:hypothetical protein K2173_013261 [Erythroxylum novogranatense]|uniref:Uncharacterized protein n=1 Tax=Erythroxylum novogranatense TaxID=1862640 RepID=A0AAV8TTL0_9ROSI|nr:hypothetical protein K2173_013261 [Erythroxylum novogranatense]